MKLSVCVLTYNHEKFVIKALQGIFNQKCRDVEVEVLVGDDLSTDRTLSVVEEYAKTHPNVKLLGTDMKLGMERNFIRVLEKCDGDFVAFCDGDDYWTDDSKVASQLAIFSRDKDVEACFHNVQIVDNKGLGKTIYPEGSPTSITFQDLMSGSYMKTCALMVRNRPGLFAPIIDRILPADDTSLCFLALENKGIGVYIDKVMSVYRIHENGIWSMIKDKNKLKWAETNLTRYIHYYGGRFDVTPLRRQLRNIKFKLMKLAFRRLNVPEVFSILSRYLFSPKRSL